MTTSTVLSDSPLATRDEIAGSTTTTNANANLVEPSTTSSARFVRHESLSARTLTRSNVAIEIEPKNVVVVDRKGTAPVVVDDDLPDSSSDSCGNNSRRARTLVWSNVTVTVRKPRDGTTSRLSRVWDGDDDDDGKKTEGKDDDDDEIKIIDNVSGVLPPRRVTAVMGPSGAGKTSLLNVLAGRVSKRNNSATRVVSDGVFLDGRPTDRLRIRRRIAFVAQDDSLPSTATPREAIRFSARLRSPRRTSERELDRRVDGCLGELGLEDCADTVLGDDASGGGGKRRVSGGERRRVSVGVELVVRPSVLFLDEPTSGLDSYSALRLVQTLRRVSRRDLTSVLCTVHQPSSEVFGSFDSLILLHKGRVMYRGDLEGVGPYFYARGFDVPLRHNPADWIMHVAQSTPVSALEKAGFFGNDSDDDNDNDVANNSALLGDGSRHGSLTSLETLDVESNLASTTNPNVRNNNVDREKRVTPFTEFATLLQREYTTLVRDPSILGARFALNILMATLIGIIFWNVGAMDDGDMAIFQSHFGAVFMVLLNSMFGSALPTLLSFPQERPVFLREYATEHYSVVTYFFSRLVVESTVTLLQVVVQTIVAYHTIRLQARYATLVAIAYALAMTSTAVAVALGCAVRDPKLGQELLPCIFVPQMLFAGFFVSTSLVPEWLRWVQYLCPLMYTTRLILLAEFENCADGLAQFNCDYLLRNNDASADDRWWYWVALLGLFLLFRVVALFVLKVKATRY